jgi:hypothetical protein
MRRGAQGSRGTVQRQPENRDAGQTVDQRRPATAGCSAVEHTDISRYKQPAGRIRIDNEEVNRSVRQITTDIDPSSAAVYGFENVT